MTLLFHDRLTDVIKRGLAHGAARSGPISFEWDVSGRCERPRPLELYARPNKFRRVHDWDPDKVSSLRLVLTVACRQCRPCLLARGNLWRRRARVETQYAPRTWFATLTFRPDVQNAAFYRVVASRGSPRDDNEEFKFRCVGLGQEITKYLKRVRKNSGVGLRYLLVAERHKSGLPHYHALFHERDFLRPLLHRDLSDSYGLGHCKFKLVQKSEEGVRYVTKYISKDASARVRASLSYGDPSRRTAATSKLPHAIAPLNIELNRGVINKNDSHLHTPDPELTSFDNMGEDEVRRFVLEAFGGSFEAPVGGVFT